MKSNNLKFIKEYIDYSNIEDSSEKYYEIKKQLKSMIEKTVKKYNVDFDDFVFSYKKNPEDNQIIGLINDYDIYEFYLKNRNDIDEILNDIKFFDDSPSKNSAYGLYDYIIVGTDIAINEIIRDF